MLYIRRMSLIDRLDNSNIAGITVYWEPSANSV